MGITAVLVALLAALTRLLGPLAGGVLAALPVLASILVVFVHRGQGPGAVIVFLRGMLVGMTGFACFCAVVTALIVPTGVAPAFAVATLTAVGVQAIGVRCTSGWSPRRAPLDRAGIT